MLPPWPPCAPELVRRCGLGSIVGGLERNMPGQANGGRRRGNALLIVLLYIFGGNLYCITIKLTLAINDSDSFLTIAINEYTYHTHVFMNACREACGRRLVQKFTAGRAPHDYGVQATRRSYWKLVAG